MDTPQSLPRNSPVKLSDQVVGRLEGDIVSGKYRPGDRLPTEAELCDTLGVSRSVVRDALRTLESMGLVHIQRRHGIVVAEPSGGQIAHALSLRLQWSDMTMADVLEARRGLEQALAVEASCRGGPQDWQRMRGILDQFRDHVAAGRQTEAHVAHLDFHLAILSALHLPALEMMLQPLHEIILISSMPREPESVEGWDIDSHVPIVDALESGSQTATRDAVRNHFTETHAAHTDEFRAMLFRDARNLPIYEELAKGISRVPGEKHRGSVYQPKAI
ncbi:MAG: GntR family transcriptional regulator [Pseudonocardiaceae bacterium]|nr:GntR family transcriptional regulator [Pseudonocardiaceae bacterium]